MFFTPHSMRNPFDDVLEFVPVSRRSAQYAPERTSYQPVRLYWPTTAPTAAPSSVAHVEVPHSWGSTAVASPQQPRGPSGDSRQAAHFNGHHPHAVDPSAAQHPFWREQEHSSGHHPHHEAAGSPHPASVPPQGAWPSFFWGPHLPNPFLSAHAPPQPAPAVPAAPAARRESIPTTVHVAPYTASRPREQLEAPSFQVFHDATGVTLVAKLPGVDRETVSFKLRKQGREAMLEATVRNPNPDRYFLSHPAERHNALAIRRVIQLPWRCAVEQVKAKWLSRNVFSVHFARPAPAGEEVSIPILEDELPPQQQQLPRSTSSKKQLLKKAQAQAQQQETSQQAQPQPCRIVLTTARLPEPQVESEESSSSPSTSTTDSESDGGVFYKQQTQTQQEADQRARRADAERASGNRRGAEVVTSAREAEEETANQETANGDEATAAALAESAIEALLQNPLMALLLGAPHASLLRPRHPAGGRRHRRHGGWRCGGDASAAAQEGSAAAAAPAAFPPGLWSFLTRQQPSQAQQQPQPQQQAQQQQAAQTEQQQQTQAQQTRTQPEQRAAPQPQQAQPQQHAAGGVRSGSGRSWGSRGERRRAGVSRGSQAEEAAVRGPRSRYHQESGATRPLQSATAPVVTHVEEEIPEPKVVNIPITFFRKPAAAQGSAPHTVPVVPGGRIDVVERGEPARDEEPVIQHVIPATLLHPSQPEVVDVTSDSEAEEPPATHSDEVESDVLAAAVGGAANAADDETISSYEAVSSPRVTYQDGEVEIREPSEEEREELASARSSESQSP